KIESRLSTIEPVSKMIQRGLTPEEILTEILGEGNVNILEKMDVEFSCQCSRERIANALISLGKDEIRDIIETEGKAEAQCHFCNETYQFSKEDLEELEAETEK
ncbi:Hsp33 family molecular chaperone HslO, partial [Bacillus sp. mrc49]